MLRIGDGDRSSGGTRELSASWALTVSGVVARTGVPSARSVDGGVGGRKPGRGRALTDEVAWADMRAAGVEPQEPYPGKTTIPWTCLCMACHTVGTPRLSNVRKGQGPCNQCAKKASGVTKRISVTLAVAIMRDAGYEPLDPYQDVRLGWRSFCLGCEQEVSPALQNVRRGHGCRKCAGLWVDPLVAQAAMRAAGYEPLEPFPGAVKPWSSVCHGCSREVAPTYSAAVRRDPMKGRCGGHVSEEDAREELVSYGAAPRAPFPGAGTPWPSQCLTCLHDITPRLATLRGGQGACVYCAQRKLDPADAHKRMVAANYRPLTPYPGRNSEPWPCRCEVCGRNVSLSLEAAMSGWGRSCCGGVRKLYPPHTTAGLYLIAHDGLRAAKIGVGIATGRRSRRLSEHVSAGWRVLGQWQGLHQYEAARLIEQTVLHGWRASGLPVFCKPEDLPQDGYTETVQLTAINVTGSLTRFPGQVGGSIMPQQSLRREGLRTRQD